MNSIEKVIHSVIGEYPFLRKPIVALYQIIFSVVPTTNYQITDFVQRHGFFFGFHDKCPWSPDNSKILAHRFDISKSEKQVESEPIEIGYFTDATLNKFEPLAFTRAWNWQQGASLQWVGKNIIYNDIYEGKSIANILDLSGKVLNTLPMHVACVSSNGRLALTYSFARLGRGMPGYGYQFTKESNKYSDTNGLGIIDLETLEYRELSSLEEISKVAPSKDMTNAFHFFSHGLFSRHGNRFLFFHRWLNPSGKLNARLFSSDETGKDLFLFPGRQYSHIAWRDTKTIIAYLKPFDMRPGYYCIEDCTGDFHSVAENFFDSDGHPQVSSDERFIITDTYPDRFRYQNLMLYDLDLELGSVIAKLRIPYSYRGKRRCDFHPRWNRDNSKICFDTAHSGVRSICVIKA